MSSQLSPLAFSQLSRRYHVGRPVRNIIEVEVAVAQLLSRCKSFGNQLLVAPHHIKSEAYVEKLLSWICIFFFDKRDPKLLQQEACNRAETDYRPKISKETIDGAHRKPNWFHVMVRRFTQACFHFIADFDHSRFLF